MQATIVLIKATVSLVMEAKHSQSVLALTIYNSLGTVESYKAIQNGEMNLICLKHIGLLQKMCAIQELGGLNAEVKLLSLINGCVRIIKL